MNRASQPLPVLSECSEIDQTADIGPGSEQRHRSPIENERVYPDGSKAPNETAKISENEDWDEWDPLNEDFNSIKNTLTIDPTKDTLASIDGKIRPIASKIGHVTICEHFAKYGECADGVYCDRFHVPQVARDRIWTLQNLYEQSKNRICLNYSHLSPQEIEHNPKITLLVSVTSGSTPGNFYFVAPYESKDFSNLTSKEISFYTERVQQSSSVKSKLQRIDEKLANLFGHTYRIDNLTDEIYVTQIVACKLSDGHFRRAMVNKLPNFALDEMNYTLFLIDVGTEVELPRELIYDIKADCLSEPPMAVNGRLNIKPANGESVWSSKALDLFFRETRGEQFMLCKVLDYLQYDRMFVVDLYKLEKRQSLTDQMIAQGYAEKCEY